MTSSRQRQRLNAHMIAAIGYAQLSHARRMLVGAVLVREDRIISVGYNGMPSGMSNDCEIEDLDGDLFTRKEVVHAEMNAIAFAAKNGIATKGATLVITHSPCFSCARLILQAGITDIVFGEEYRDRAGIDFLEDAGLGVVRLDLVA